VIQITDHSTQQQTNNKTTSKSQKYVIWNTLRIMSIAGMLRYVPLTWLIVAVKNHKLTSVKQLKTTQTGQVIIEPSEWKLPDDGRSHGASWPGCAEDGLTYDKFHSLPHCCC
jgi:hypothetical protein